MSKTIAPETNSNDKTMLGFWIYLMTDCVLFASLFATFVVLRHNTAGGEGGAQLFTLPLVLAETLILLTSSFMCGMSLLAAQARSKRWTLWTLAVVALLGLMFLNIEFSEFIKLHNEGNGWQRSAFLSAFFSLVGTHGLHISLGLVWLATTAYRLTRYGFTAMTLRQLRLFSMFWHFLDVVWIFIFTVVYLLGAVQ